MRCIICGILIDSIEDAIEAGWIPYFHEGEQEHEPACRECWESLLQVDENGEMEVKEEYRGKINYLYGREPKERPGSGWVIGIAVTEEHEGPMH
jgi:hypothetical protein